jgi:hypothetical protein
MKKQICFFFLLLVVHATASAQQFKVSYSPKAFDKSFTGKVILYLSKENKNPKNGAVDIDPFPCFSIAVKNIKPGADIIFDDKAVYFPAKLSDIERGAYYVQAVWDRNLGGRSIASSPGNVYSRPVKVAFTKNTGNATTIVCDQVVAEPRFKETTFIKELRVNSKLLSAFSEKKMTVDAAVILPAEYFTDLQRRFPVTFNVSGYGGDYHRYSGDTMSRSLPLDTIPCITVYLDGNCSLGHSVYANSDNNGPWGDALIKEFIPALENNYRCNGARFLRGHSSGGWTVLWLQTHYPDIFAACWSSSPDPVDFRNFQKINLYKGENMYYDRDSSLRNIATVAGFFPWVSAKQASQQENVIYRGEQMHSFDAVFSEKGTDGNPLRICDPVTGELNKSCFEHWKKYDISFYVLNNWSSLKNQLEGKIRVSVGEQDNFLLNGAVHLFENEMKNIDSKFVFSYYPGDHFTVSTPEYRKAGMEFLAQKYNEWKEQSKKAF